MASIDQDNQLDFLGPTEIDQRIQGRSDCPSGVQHVVDEEDSLVVNRKRDLGLPDERLRPDGMTHQVVAIQRDIQCPGGNRFFGDMVKRLRDAPGNHHATGADPDKRDVVQTAVPLDDFMGDTGQRPAHAVGVHDDGHQHTPGANDRSLVERRRSTEGMFIALVGLAGPLLKSETIIKDKGRGAREKMRFEQLLVALDVDNAIEAIEMSARLGDLAGGFKVGSQLFTAEGPDLVRRLVKQGHRVFLDLKFHDIPNTITGAVRSATRLGVWMLTVHASGGVEMLKAARRAAVEAAQSDGRTPPLVIAVTVLTSISERMLPDIGVSRPLAHQAEEMAKLAELAGLDGIVASPQELAFLRPRFPRLKIVTPGIRAMSSARDDQSRTLSAAEALAAGADYLVVGRPIVAAADPRQAATELARSVAR